MNNDRFWLNPIIWLLAVAGLLFMALAHSVAYAGEVDLVKLRKQVLANTIQLNGNCSGTLISSKRDDKTGKVETLVLTAKHCVENGSSDMVVDIPVYQSNRVVKKDSYVARLKGKYSSADLALVVLKDTQTFFESVAKIAPANVMPVMGEQVWTVGYPLGLQLTITPGLFGSLETLNFPSNGIEYFRASPHVVGGNSGGGLYRQTGSGDFDLIGVTTAAHQAFTFIAFYTPIDAVHAYLRVSAPGTVPPAETAPVVKAGGN